MKILWLFLFLVSSLCAMEDHSLAIIADAQDPLYSETMLAMSSISKQAIQSAAEFTSITQAQQKRIRKLNKLLEQSETTQARLLVATCISSAIAASFVIREILARYQYFRD